MLYLSDDSRKPSKRRLAEGRLVRVLIQQFRHSEDIYKDVILPSF